MESSYNVKTQVFEGPLELLLSLIEKRKLHINDITLAKVADDYIAHIKNLEEKSGIISDLAQFILIASTLVLIKSKSLLPALTLSEEEEASIEELERRLEEYKKYKELSRHLREKFGKNIEYERLPPKEKTIVFTPDKYTTIVRIFETAKSLIASIPKAEHLPKAIVEKVVSLEEMIVSLTERVSKSIKMSFREFSNHGKTEKVNVIVSFLAMLELVKQGIINVRQDKHFHDIEMETYNVDVPKY